MKYYSKEVDPLEYLKKCISNWTTFCESHRVLAESIRYVIEENEDLRKQNEKVTCDRCKHRYKESCPLFYGEANGLQFFASCSKQDDFWCKKGENK